MQPLIQMRLSVIALFGLFGLVASTAEARYAPIVNPPGRPWVRIGSPTPSRLGTEYFIVGHQAGEFRRLRISRQWGAIDLRRVEVLTQGQRPRIFEVHDRLLTRPTSPRAEQTTRSAWAPRATSPSPSRPRIRPRAATA